VVVAALAVDAILFGARTRAPGQGSGRAAAQTRAVPPFTGLDLTGANNVVVDVGGTRRSVVVHGDDNLLDRVTTRVRGGRLVIGTTPGSFSTITPMHVTVRVPSLDRLALDGDGNIAAHGIDARRLAVTLSGNGNIEASGSTGTLDVALGGAGTVALRGLAARDARAEISGDGTITLTATRRLTARISGTGSILYGGAPGQVDRVITGDGTIGPG